ncbi:MAG: HK97 family phage prohead protease [Patescibacteria group bacterium]|nr:HK97 family phage prohead protease [Patescibacteria group bacterium]
MPKYVVNGATLNWAKTAIADGKISQDPWSLDGADKEKMLGDKQPKDWEFYSEHFLAYDPDQPKDTEEKYHYPIGKGDVVYVHAVSAVRSRASEAGQQDIFKAAGDIEAAIQEHKQSKTKESEPKRELSQSIEYRHLSEVRVTEPTDNSSIGVVSGTIRFNSLSHDLGGFQERIDPAAFDDSLSEGDLVALFQHDRQKPLGSQRSGTLKVNKNPDGLTYSIDLPDTSYARDLKALMTGRKEMRGSSFGFHTVADSWDRPAVKGGLPIRTIKKAHLLEISPVTTPAYPANGLSVRSVTIPPGVLESEPTPEPTPEPAKTLPVTTATKILTAKKHDPV